MGNFVTFGAFLPKAIIVFLYQSLVAKHSHFMRQNVPNSPPSTRILTSIATY